MKGCKETDHTCNPRVRQMRDDWEEDEYGDNEGNGHLAAVPEYYGRNAPYMVDRVAKTEMKSVYKPKYEDEYTDSDTEEYDEGEIEGRDKTENFNEFVSPSQKGVPLVVFKKTSASWQNQATSNTPKTSPEQPKVNGTKVRIVSNSTITGPAGQGVAGVVLGPANWEVKNYFSIGLMSDKDGG